MGGRPLPSSSFTDTLVLLDGQGEVKGGSDTPLALKPHPAPVPLDDLSGDVELELPLEPSGASMAPNRHAGSLSWADVRGPGMVQEPSKKRPARQARLFPNE